MATHLHRKTDSPLPTRHSGGMLDLGSALPKLLAPGYPQSLLLGSSVAAHTSTLLAPEDFRRPSSRQLAPPRHETRQQRLEAMLPCAMMAVLCRSPRSVIPTSRRDDRDAMALRFQEAGDVMVSDLPLREANAMTITIGEMAGEVMYDFASPYAGAKAVSPYTAALACNLWLEDRLFVDRLQPDGARCPDLGLEPDSIFHEGNAFANAWADFNELILGLPDCPYHDPDSLARISRTARKLVGPMHARLQQRGLYLSKEIFE